MQVLYGNRYFRAHPMNGDVARDVTGGLLRFLLFASFPYLFTFWSRGLGEIHSLDEVFEH